MDVFRVGRISSINPEAGTVRVTYEDRDGAVTPEIPLFSPYMHYWMPRAGDSVMVLHFPNGSALGLCLGRYWCKENPPPEGAAELYRHDMERGGQCYIRHAEGGILQIYAPNGIELVGDTKIIGNTEITETATVQKQTTINGLTQCTAGLSATGSSGGISGAVIDGNIRTTGTIAAAGEITSGSVGLQGHTHTAQGEKAETSTAH